MPWDGRGARGHRLRWPRDRPQDGPDGDARRTIGPQAEATDRSTLDAEVLTSLNQWMALNYGRHLLTFAAWIFALRALSTPIAAEIEPRQGRDAEASKEEGGSKPTVQEKVA